MEGCFSERLRSLSADFDTSTPDYRALTTDVAALERRFVDMTGLIGEPFAGFPRRLGCLDAATLLLAMGDEFMKRAGMEGEAGLRSIQKLAEYRNRSVLAHGTETLTPERSKELKKGATKLIAELWKLEVPQEFLFPLDKLLFAKLGT